MMSKSFFTAIMLLLFVSACKEEETNPACEPCETLVRTTNLAVVYYATEQQQQPCFNPNNNDECVFIKRQNNQPYQLIKYTISTKKEEVLYESDGVFQNPLWARNNQIIFRDYRYGNILLDVASKTLTQLPTDYYAFNLFWKDDETIAYARQTTDPLYLLHYNLKTQHKDSFPISTYKARYNFINECASIGENGFIILKDAKIIDNIPSSYEKYSFPHEIAWHPNNEDIYYCNRFAGIFKVNKKTKKYTKIRSGCNSREYCSISISGDGQKLLVERDDATLEYGAIKHASSVYMMDINGYNETRITY